MRKESFRKSFYIFCILLLFFSCGRKKWPVPIKKEDTFNFGKINVYKDKGCLKIKGIIIGNIKNMKELWLELEGSGSCIKCPFQPTFKIKYNLSSESLELRHDSFLLTYCKNKGHKFSRLRIVGINRYRKLSPVFSKIIVIKNLDEEN